MFSMSVFPEQAENFCTCGEDGSVRVWRGKGRNCPLVVCNMVVNRLGRPSMQALPGVVQFEMGHIAFDE